MAALIALFLNRPKLFVLTCSLSTAFSHVLHIYFSTRTVGLLNTCARIGRTFMNVRRDIHECSAEHSWMFRPPERRYWTTPPNVIEYQCVAMQIFTLKIYPKITFFRSFLILRARHKIAISHLPKPQNADVTKRTNRLVKQKQIKPQKTFLITSTSRRLALLSPSRARARIIYKVFSLSANNHSFVFISSTPNKFCFLKYFI